MVELTFLLSLLVIFGLGIASILKSRKSRADYYLASSSVPPWLVALSAIATLNSGYMFTGLIGFTYVVGLDSIWLMVGWVAGDLAVSFLVYKQIRIASERTGEVSYAAVIARWQNGDFQVWRRVAAVILVLFLTSYAAAQIAAGGKAFFATLDLPPALGAIITGVMVLAYSAAGGIRASIWTDAAQFSIMLAAMSLLIFAGVTEAGGLTALYESLQAIPGYLDLYPDSPIVPGLGGLLLFILGWIFAGVSIIGQPHIMVRYMALDDPSRIAETRLWYYSFYLVFMTLAHSAGLIARVLLPELGDGDPELALLSLARMLLPDILLGLVLTGIFAATMSTVDSLVLSSSAALTNDLLPRSWSNVRIVKIATAVVIMIALVLALAGVQSVFSLVILSWSVLGSAFAPILLLFAFKRTLSEVSAIVAMVAGAGVALLWRYVDLHHAVYEGLPGILAGLSIAWFMSRRLRSPLVSSKSHVMATTQREALDE